MELRQRKHPKSSKLELKQECNSNRLAVEMEEWGLEALIWSVEAVLGHRTSLDASGDTESH